MAEPFLSEIRIMSFNFPPKTWALCNGQFMPINQNQALFSLLGTTYGGNGQTTFALPDLRGRTPTSMGGGFTLGQAAGQETHTLTQAEIPMHMHIMQAFNGPATTGAAATPPTGNSLAQGLAIQSGNNSAAVNFYSTAPATGTMSPNMIGITGGSQAHENRQPYLVLNFCIALSGIFPSQN